MCHRFLAHSREKKTLAAWNTASASSAAQAAAVGTGVTKKL